MPHFFINLTDIKGNLTIINNPQDCKHIFKVLRYKIGDTLLLFDENKMQYETVIESMSSSQIVSKIVKSYPSNRILGWNLCLAQSILKTDAQNSLIQKATELGVKTIIPFISDNSTIKKSVAIEKLEKWQKIACESVKQCERADFPKLVMMSSIEEILSSFDYILIFAEKYANTSVKQALKGVDVSSNILILVGPEGGWSEMEFKFFKQKNIPLCPLGNLILRADTAVVAGISTVIYELNSQKYLMVLFLY